jgi:hypothetical protein
MMMCDDLALFVSRMTESEPSTSFVEDFPAKISVLRAVERVLRASAAGSGESTKGWSVKYDRNSSSWRTLQLCWLEGSETYSAGWPRSGMMRNGTAYPLPMLVPDSFGIESGLWPTPNATAFKGGRTSPRRGVARPERNNWQDWCSLVLGQRYPVPETAEQVMGFPTGYTEISLSETP